MPAPGRIVGNTRECFVSFCFVIFLCFAYKVVGSILFVHMCYWALFSFGARFSPLPPLPRCIPSLTVSFLLPYPRYPFAFPTSLEISSFLGWLGDEKLSLERFALHTVGLEFDPQN